MTSTTACFAGFASVLLALACTVEVDDPGFGSGSGPTGADDGGDAGGDSGPGSGGEDSGDGGDGGSDGDTGSDPDDPPAQCGDGVVDGAEDCDDAGESASCNADCSAAACGDGKLNESAGEICDGIVQIDNVNCSAECELACESDFGDCNDDIEADGCETLLLMADACGACGVVCGEGTSCVQGGCTETNTHGNDVEYPDGNIGLAHHLLGNMVSLPQDATVTHLSLFAKEGGMHGMLALYADQGDEPVTLVAQTPSVEVAIGLNELPVHPPVDLQAGDYWLLAVYDNNASIGIDTSDPNVIVKYIPFTFGNDFPDPYPAGKEYTGQSLNYFVNVVP